jgi:hypothetical protein
MLSFGTLGMVARTSRGQVKGVTTSRKGRGFLGPSNIGTCYQFVTTNAFRAATAAGPDSCTRMRPPIPRQACDAGLSLWFFAT